MTVTIPTSKFQYAGDGIVTSFAFNNVVYPLPFAPKPGAGLTVAVSEDADTSNLVILVEDTDYTVAFQPDFSSATINTVAPVAVGFTLTIQRSQPYTQNTDYVEGGPFPADTTEVSFDLLVLQIQTIAEQLESNIFTLPPGSQVDTNLPAPQANNIWTWNDTGDAIEYKSIAQIIADDIGTLTLNNNTPIQWRDTGDIAENFLVLDGADAFNVGNSGFPTRIRGSDVAVLNNASFSGTVLFGNATTFSQPADFTLGFTTTTMTATGVADFTFANFANNVDITGSLDVAGGANFTGPGQVDIFDLTVTGPFEVQEVIQLIAYDNPVPNSGEIWYDVNTLQFLFHQNGNTVALGLPVVGNGELIFGAGGGFASDSAFTYNDGTNTLFAENLSSIAVNSANAVISSVFTSTGANQFSEKLALSGYSNVTPNNGEFWFDGVSFRFRQQGADVVLGQSPAAGANAQVQYNSGGALDASADFTFIDGTSELILNGDANFQQLHRVGERIRLDPWVSGGLVNGDIWLDNGDGRFKCREGGITKNLTDTGGGGGNPPAGPTNAMQFKLDASNFGGTADALLVGGQIQIAQDIQLKSDGIGLVSDADNKSIRIEGGTSNSAGEIVLFGSTHPTDPRKVKIRSFNQDVIVLDNATMTVSQPILMAFNNAFIGRATDNGELELTGDSSNLFGAIYRLYGSANGVNNGHEWFDGATSLLKVQAAGATFGATIPVNIFNTSAPSGGTGGALRVVGGASFQDEVHVAERLRIYAKTGQDVHFEIVPEAGTDKGGLFRIDDATTTERIVFGRPTGVQAFAIGNGNLEVVNFNPRHWFMVGGSGPSQGFNKAADAVVCCRNDGALFIGDGNSPSGRIAADEQMTHGWVCTNSPGTRMGTFWNTSGQSGIMFGMYQGLGVTSNWNAAGFKKYTSAGRAAAIRYSSGANNDIIFSFSASTDSPALGGNVNTNARVRMDEIAGGMAVQWDTESTSTGTGALTVSGGLGVAKRLTVGNSVELRNQNTPFLDFFDGSTRNFRIQCRGNLAEDPLRFIPYPAGVAGDTLLELNGAARDLLIRGNVRISADSLTSNTRGSLEVTGNLDSRSGVRLGSTVSDAGLSTEPNVFGDQVLYSVVHPNAGTFNINAFNFRTKSGDPITTPPIGTVIKVLFRASNAGGDISINNNQTPITGQRIYTPDGSAITVNSRTLVEFVYMSEASNANPGWYVCNS